jgi:hypothetical protein
MSRRKTSVLAYAVCDLERIAALCASLGLHTARQALEIARQRLELADQEQTAPVEPVVRLSRFRAKKLERKKARARWSQWRTRI